MVGGNDYPMDGYRKRTWAQRAESAEDKNVVAVAVVVAAAILLVGASVSAIAWRMAQ